MSDTGTSYRVHGARRAPRRCYVYAHLGPDRVPFYIGKGTGSRAWSIDCNAHWHQFVRILWDSAYEVAIIAEDLDEEAALELEDELISQHSATLTNWINPGRQFYYEALERYHALRDATKSLVSATRPLESSDPEQAVMRYRKAIQQMLEYTAITTETGLVAQLRKEVGEPVRGDVEALDRLTVTLRKLGRYSELVETVDAYFKRCPDSEWPSHAVVRRRAEAVAILAGERKPNKPRAAKPRLLKSGTVPEAMLAPFLEKARRDRYPYDWKVVAKLCRAHHDHEREITLLEEYLSGPRVVGKAWLEVEERLFKLRAMLGR